MSRKQYTSQKQHPVFTWIGVRIACFLILQWGTISLTHGQSTEPVKKQELEPPTSTVQQPDPPSLDIDLGALRKNLQDYPELVVDSERPNVNNPPIDELPIPTPSEQDVLAEELEASRQINEIGSRIRKLMELQKSLPVPTTNESKSAPGNPVVSVPEPTAANQDTDEFIAIDPSIRNIETTRILDTPPDQIALADNLFYTGEIDLALNIYQKALQATPESSENHTWIRFQIAACYRRMEKFDDASKILRKIAEGSDSDPIVVNARWWLDTIERKRKLLESIAILDQFIQRKSDELNDE